MRHIVTRYYGIKLGWAPFVGSGRPRTKQDAEQFCSYWKRIDPVHSYKVQVLEPELPSFV
jgi:hypothetical protein